MKTTQEIEQSASAPSALDGAQLAVIHQIAAALGKLMPCGASLNFGADCLLHAALAQRILAEHDMIARLVVGEAAWRVGPGDDDVIVHSPFVGGQAPTNAGLAVPFHAWLELGSTVLDFSTHSLRHKAAQLDAQDGGKTTVAWCPTHLVIAKSETKTLQEVAQAPLEGVALYRELPRLHELMLQRGKLVDVDEDDVNMFRFIFKNTSMVVIGFPAESTLIGA